MVRCGRCTVAWHERIRDQVRLLSQFTDAGRPGRIAGTRELIVKGTLLIVAYRVTGPSVLSLRVLHSARRWPGALSDIRPFLLLRPHLVSSLLPQHVVHQRHNSKRDEQRRQRYRRDESEVLETEGTGQAATEERPQQ